eukprot:6165639-Pleurochrysis_carterae.AAC.2
MPPRAPIADLARPCASRPYATVGWPSSPRVHTALRRRPRCGDRAAACASVVYLRAAAPSAHWANVVATAWAASSAARALGSIQSGAWSRKRGHHATPPSSPQSAGCSSADGTPAWCAARTTPATKSASAFCFSR